MLRTDRLGLRQGRAATAKARLSTHGPDEGFFNAVAQQVKGKASESLVTMKDERCEMATNRASVRKQINNIVSNLARLQLKQDDLAELKRKIERSKGSKDSKSTRNTYGRSSGNSPRSTLRLPTKRSDGSLTSLSRKSAARSSVGTERGTSQHPHRNQQFRTG